jgi:putative lipoprotein (rSAM/lipoprotein system)
MKLITSASHLFYLRILKLLSLALGFLLSVMCKNPFEVLPLYGVAKYGMPYADYKIIGSIKAADNLEAIAGIKVSVRDTGCTCQAKDSVFTDGAGKYSLEFSQPPWNSAWLLEAADIDGENNGNFTLKDTVVSIPDSTLTGGDGEWYNGHGEKNVDIDLDRVN